MKTKLLKYIKRNFLQFSFFAILCLGFFLRFWNLQEYLYFNLDEERDLFIIRRILFDYHPTLIGGSVPGGFYLGPGYFYITSVFAFFAQMSPVGLGVVAATLGTATIILVHVVAKKLFDSKTALAAAALYASSYLIVIYNKIYWPLIFAPIITLLVYYSLAKIVVEKKFKWIMYLTLFLIVGVQSDPATFSLLVLAIVVFLIYKIPIRNRYTIWGILLFFISHLPLVFFDIRHEFLNTKALISLFTGGKNSSEGIDFSRAISGIPLFFKTFSRIIYTASPHEVSQQISPCSVYQELRSENLNLPATVLALGSMTFLVKDWFFERDFGQKIILLHIAIGLFGVFTYNLFFPGYTYEWFFYVYFPTFILIIGYFLASIKIKVVSLFAGFILSILVLANSYSIISGTNQFGFKQKKQAVEFALKSVKDKPFSLDSIGACFAWGGYRYLFWYYQSDPATSYMDHLYGGWLYPTSWIAKEHADIGVVMVDHDFYLPGGDLNDKYYTYMRRYREYKEHLITSERFGRTEVLIIDNKDKWMDW